MAALQSFRDEGVDAIAIAFLNSFAHPAHELAAMEALRDHGFTGSISLSHQVSGEYREYERTTTTIIDAFVRPRMTQYLRELGTGLQEAGFGGNLLVTRSGGGSFHLRRGGASDRSRRSCRDLWPGRRAPGNSPACSGLATLSPADVGGTSFDTSLIVDGRPRLLYEGSVVGLPVQTPWVDVRSIGAGGGSIAHVDAGGLLRVGPQSAGADPGPAAYGRGGTEPTVTDAAHVLGMLGDGKIAHHITLDRGVVAEEPGAGRHTAWVSGREGRTGRAGDCDRDDVESHAGDYHRAGYGSPATSGCSPLAARDRCSARCLARELGVRGSGRPAACRKLFRQRIAGR